jgi:aminotransferase in exopolysaccharide biosynthesis
LNAEQITNFIRELYKSNDFIPLHAPTFGGNEKKYVLETIDSTFVSSVGKFVDQFEKEIELFTGSAKAVATVNGTAALHAALYVAGVKRNDLVITQALTFVATGNVIYHMGAEPIFVDVSLNTLGLCPQATAEYLEDNAILNADGQCIHKKTRRRIKAVVPMHTFGHPVELDELICVCKKWNLSIVEDAAESLGSYYKGKHTGTIGEFGALSFNGNKIITTGGGGIVLCSSDSLGERVKHITTTAKKPHPYEFFHDEAGFNYRMPNLNAALGCAQIEVLSDYVQQKRATAMQYQEFFKSSEIQFFQEPEHCKSNYWLNTVICPDKESRTALLKFTNRKGVMTRPIWTLIHRLPMFENTYKGRLTNSEFLENRVVNLPSSPAAL